MAPRSTHGLAWDTRVRGHPPMPWGVASSSPRGSFRSRRPRARGRRRSTPSRCGPAAQRPPPPQKLSNCEFASPPPRFLHLAARCGPRSGATPGIGAEKLHCAARDRQPHGSPGRKAQTVKTTAVTPGSGTSSLHTAICHREAFARKGLSPLRLYHYQTLIMKRSREVASRGMKSSETDAVSVRQTHSLRLPVHVAMTPGPTARCQPQEKRRTRSS